MYTKLDLVLADREAYGLLRRAERGHRRTTVTVQSVQQLAGRPGGDLRGKHQRDVVHHHELAGFWENCKLTTFLRFGKGKNVVILRQKRRAAVGARWSKLVSPLALGAGEHDFASNVDRQKAHGFFIEGFSFPELF